MKTITTTVYKTIDGKIFDTEDAAKQHEKRIKNLRFFVIHHGPDLTEDRGYFKRTYATIEQPVKIFGKDYTLLMLQDWAYRNFGRPIAFVQGRVITENWKIKELTKEEFENPTKPSVGNYKFAYDVIHLKLGECEKGLIEEN